MHWAPHYYSNHLKLKLHLLPLRKSVITYHFSSWGLCEWSQMPNGSARWCQTCPSLQLVYPDKQTQGRNNSHLPHCPVYRGLRSGCGWCPSSLRLSCSERMPWRRRKNSKCYKTSAATLVSDSQQEICFYLCEVRGSVRCKPCIN